MPRGKAIPVEIRQEIHRLVRLEGITNARAICRYLAQKFTDVPHERTVRNIVRELAPPDPSEPWQPSPDDDPEGAALVLETLSAVALSRGKWPQVTKEHALWIAWLRKGWPDMEPMLAFSLAEDYRARHANQRTTEDLDALLAYTPWRSEEHFYRWLALCELEKIPAAHIGYTFMVVPREPAPSQKELEELGALFGEEEDDGQAPQGES